MPFLIDIVVGLDEEELSDAARQFNSVYMCPKSIEAAKVAAESTIQLATSIATGKLSNGFAIVRPPGHHAEAHTVFTALL